MVKLGFSLQQQYTVPTEPVIRLLAENGFSAVSPVWSPELNMEQLVTCCRTYGMGIQSLHAPHKGISLLWQPDTPEAKTAQDNIFRCVEACARFRVPVMVLHGWQGLIYTFPKEPLDFHFFDSLVAYAREKGVSIAFENLEGEEYLEALLLRYRNMPHIGYCWDSGHDHCYPHRTDYLAAYGHRLMMTHLNDNFGLRDPKGIPSGDDDLHLLPFDGNLNWPRAIGRLKTAPRQDIINFELKTLSHSRKPEDLLYERLSPEAFIQAAADRARQIAQLYDA